VFGQKDAQQVAVVKAMVRDLSFRTEIVVGATVREPDGLALSSRNAYLDEDGRAAATALYRALETGRAAAATEGAGAAAEAMQAVLDAAEGVEIDYAAAVDPYTFGPPRGGEPLLLAVAARVAGTRLIDNVLLQP
jgi:pantoate--beta-alanine ligase